jgi:hypothetical protein
MAMAGEPGGHACRQGGREGSAVAASAV